MRQAPLSASLGVAWDHPRMLACLLATLLALPVLLATTHASGSHSPSFEVSTAAANEGRSAAAQGSYRQVAAQAAPTTTSGPGHHRARDDRDRPGHHLDGAALHRSTHLDPAGHDRAADDRSSHLGAAARDHRAAAARPHSPRAAPSPASRLTTHDPNGGCAHKTLPFGTVVHVTASNGKTATCVVDDRGPFGAGRILDLDTAIFAKLAPLGHGVVSVTVTW